MTHPRHLTVVEEGEDTAHRLAIDQAWQIFNRTYPNAETRRSMLGSLRRMARLYLGEECPVRSFPWHWLVTEQLAYDVWAPSRDTYASKTAKKDAAALKAVLRCHFRAGVLTLAQYRAATSFDTRIRRVSPKSLSRGLQPDELDLMARIIRAGNHPTKVARDLALLLVLASTGARRQEIANVQLSQVDLTQRRLRLTKTKNGEERHAWLHPNASQALVTWIGHRGRQEGPLFSPLTRACTPMSDRPLSAHQMWKIVRTYAHAAGLGDVAPHDLRRFAVSSLLDLGYDLSLVSRIVGHKQVTTTVMYDRRPEERCREAVASLPLPEPPRGEPPHQLH